MHYTVIEQEELLNLVQIIIKLHFAGYSDINVLIFLQPKAKKKMSLKVPKDDSMTEETENDLDGKFFFVNFKGTVILK